jgi:hypothetical protein
MNLASSGFTTTAVMPTGFTTYPQTVTVKPLNVVLQQATDFIVGFLTFVLTLFKPSQ